MFKTSIRIHAYILLFPFFTGIPVTEATAQTVSLPETCRHIGNTEACVMTEDDAMTDSSHTADEPSADMKIYRTEACRLESPQTQDRATIMMMPKNIHIISYTNSNTFYAYIGYGRIMSKLHMAEGVKGNPRNGLFWQFGYDWTSKLGIGAGMMYNGFRSTYEHNGYREKSEIFYLAPQIGLKNIRQAMDYRRENGFRIVHIQLSYALYGVIRRQFRIQPAFRSRICIVENHRHQRVYRIYGG